MFLCPFGYYLFSFYYSLFGFYYSVLIWVRECVRVELGVGRGRSRLCRRYSRRVTPPRRCLPPNFRVIVMSCLTDFGSALVECFDLFPSTLCSPNLFCLSLVDCFPDARGSAPRAPRKPAGARLDRALFLAHSFVFLLGFVGRQSDRLNSILAVMPIIMNYEL